MKPKRSIRTIVPLLLLVVSSLSACARDAEGVSLTINNDSTYVYFYEVYLKPLKQEEWGVNWLKDNELVKPGELFKIPSSFPSGFYTLKILACDDLPVLTAETVELESQDLLLAVQN